MSRVLTPLLVACLVLVACVQDSRPAECDEASVEVALTLTADALDPADPAVCRGQEVVFLVESSLDAVFHVHGYDEALPAADVVAGDVTRLEFTADRAGQFPIEIHAHDDPEGVEVGILTVHEE